MATIGDIFFNGAKALNIQTNTPQWISFLSSDEAKEALPTDNADAALAALQSRFMTYSQALENHGVVKQLTASGAGMIKEKFDRTLKDWLKESGISSPDIDELIQARNLSPEQKWQTIYSKILDAGKASVPPPKQGDKGNHDLELMKTQHAAALRELNAKLEAKEREFSDRETGWKREKATGALIDYARKNFPIAGADVLAEPYYRTVAEALANEYEITHSTSGEIILMDKTAPNTIATDPKTGNPLQVKNVLSSRIPADLIKKQDPPPIGAKTVVGGVNGDADRPVLNPTQQAAREEWLKQYPELAERAK